MNKEKETGEKEREKRLERPIPPKLYPVIDTDLARDNLESHIPAADLNDL